MSQYNNHSITFEVPEKVKEALVVLAFRNQTTIQALMEVAVDIMLDNPPEPDDMSDEPTPPSVDVDESDIV